MTIRKSLTALAVTGLMMGAISPDVRASMKEEEEMTNDFSVREYKLLHQIYDGEFKKHTINDLDDLSSSCSEHYLNSFNHQLFSVKLIEERSYIANAYSAQSHKTKMNICNFINTTLQEEKNIKTVTKQYILSLFQEIHRYLYY